MQPISTIENTEYGISLILPRKVQTLSLICTVHTHHTIEIS